MFKYVNTQQFCYEVAVVGFLQITSCVVETVLMTVDVWVARRNQWMTLFGSYFCDAFATCESLLLNSSV